MAPIKQAHAPKLNWPLLALAAPMTTTTTATPLNSDWPPITGNFEANDDDVFTRLD